MGSPTQGINWVSPRVQPALAGLNRVKVPCSLNGEKRETYLYANIGLIVDKVKRQQVQDGSSLTGAILAGLRQQRRAETV